jgi:hypothetical protein
MTHFPKEEGKQADAGNFGATRKGFGRGHQVEVWMESVKKVLQHPFFVVWYVIVINKCLGEAQGFSAWRAFGSFLLAVITPAVVAMGLVVLVTQVLAG